MWKRTQTGTIKYDRRRKEFTKRDVIRILKKIYVDPSGYQEILRMVLQLFNESVSTEERLKLVKARIEDFGGGEFGGGGATRNMED